MPLNLHSAAKERITTLLAKALPEISAEKGMFLDWRAVFIALWQAEHALPQNGKLHNLLVNIIDEFPLIEFVRSTLATELYDLDKYRSDVDSIKLTEIQEYSDPTAVASRLVDLFDSLPWNYVLSVPLRPDLGSLLPTNNSEYQLGPEVNIVCPNEDFAQQFPLAADTERQNQRIHPPSNPFSDPFAANPFSDPFAASLDGSALSPRSPTPNRSWNSTLYLQIRADGFIGSYGGSEPALNAERTIRAICGLGIALWLFDFERKYSPEIPSYLVVHRRVGGRWKIETQFKATDRTSRALDGLKLHALDGLDTDQSRIAWRSRKLDEMQITFSAGDKAQSIILASQWLMNSYTERDELLSYVQAMVVLEILLGDKATSDEIGLGQLLRNRCAYLIGNGHEDREKLLRTFEDIYRIRSQIVHAGKHRLTREERVLFHQLHMICHRVLQKEVALLVADARKPWPSASILR